MPTGILLPCNVAGASHLHVVGYRNVKSEEGTALEQGKVRPDSETASSTITCTTVDSEAGDDDGGDDDGGDNDNRDKDDGGVD